MFVDPRRSLFISLIVGLMLVDRQHPYLPLPMSPMIVHPWISHFCWPQAPIVQLYKTFVLMCVDKVLAHLEVCAAKLEMWILEATGAVY